MGAWQYYAVARGANPGIYESWKQAKAAIGDEYPNPKYKGFDDQDKALAFIDSYSAPRKKKKQPKQEEFTFIPAEDPVNETDSRELRQIIDIYKALPTERKICLYLFATYIKNFSGCAYECSQIGGGRK